MNQKMILMLWIVMSFIIKAQTVISPPDPPRGCVLRAQFYESPADYPVAVGVICSVAILENGKFTSIFMDGTTGNITVYGLRTFHAYVDAPNAEYIAFYSGAPPELFLPVVVK